MPGFKIGGKGAADIANTVETRRKHRWVFQALNAAADGAGLKPNILIVLQKCARPSFSFEEPQMHHDQEQVYFAGKQTWEPIAMSFYDVVGAENDVSEAIWNWLNSAVDVHGDAAGTVKLPSEYKADADLSMIDNTGKPEETWKLFGCWPKEVNWGELNYTDTEIQLIEVTMRYDRANREL